MRHRMRSRRQKADSASEERRGADSTMSVKPESALLLEPGSPRSDPEIGRVVARELNLVPADVIAQIRYGGGIIVSRGEETALNTIREQLEEIGIHTRVVSTEALTALPRGIRVTSIDLREETLIVQPPGGREIVLLSTDVEALHVHALKQDRPGDRDCEGNLRVPLFSARKEGQISARGLRILDWMEELGGQPPQFVLTLYTSDPVGPIRIDRESADYSLLGDKKTHHSIDNFVLLAEFLVQRYPHALNRDRLVRFVEGADLQELLYYKREEAQSFDRWIQAWIFLHELSGTHDRGDSETTNGE